MLDTQESIKEAEKVWDEIFKRDGITDEEAMSSKYDYLDDDED